MSFIFKNLPVTGVMSTMNKAKKLGYSEKNSDWINFGQGAPTTLQIDGDVSRINNLNFDAQSYNYQPVNGIAPLRKKIADYYNQLFGELSNQETNQGIYPENILIAGGTRLVLACIMAMLENNTTVGYLNPDYAQYTEIVGIFGENVNTVAIELNPDDGFKINLDIIEKAISEQGIKVLLFSNPSNPTGNCIAGQDLQRLVEISEKYNCYIICDEIYGRYYYENNEILSITKYIKDFQTTKIIAVDGLSKSFRYPSWRVGWCVANPQVIQTLETSNSASTGGASILSQIGAMQLIDSDTALIEKTALSNNFKIKRDYLVEALISMNFEIKSLPKGAFYVWADVSKLPNGYNTGDSFVENMLQNKIITIKGNSFDVNPNTKRQSQKWQNYVRFAFGQELESIQKGVEIMREILVKK